LNNMRFGWLHLPFTGTTPYERLPADPAQTEFDLGAEANPDMKSEKRKGDVWAWYLATVCRALPNRPLP
jgi:hypothetical protein